MSDDQENSEDEAADLEAAKDEEASDSHIQTTEDDVPVSQPERNPFEDDFELPVKKSSLKSRIISAVILAPVILYIVISGGPVFLLLMGAAAAIASYEWAKMVKPLAYNYMHAMIGASYIAVFLAAALILRLGLEQGAWLSIILLFAVWGSDVGAYMVGKTFKGAKLAPKISPNKTRSGLYGAMGSAALVLLIFFAMSNLFGSYINTDLGLKSDHTWWIFLVGCFIGLIGQMGDLFVSVYKRQSGLKDTGHIIPGHGGLLDRIDALILVCPCYLGIVWIWLH